jgi:hypothetical protein
MQWSRGATTCVGLEGLKTLSKKIVADDPKVKMILASTCRRCSSSSPVGGSLPSRCRRILRAFVAGGEAAAWLVDMTEAETSTG